MQRIFLYWVRRDLRLTDNPALAQAAHAAREHNALFLPVFVLEDYMRAGDPAFQFGLPQRQFLAKALPHFLSHFNEALVLTGRGAERIHSLVTFFSTHGYTAEVFVNDDIYPDFYKQVEKLTKLGVTVTTFNDQLTIAKDTKTQTGNTYGVFTPFKKAVWQQFLTAPIEKKVSPSSLSYPHKKLLEEIPNQLVADEDSLLSVCAKTRTLRVHGTRTHTLNLDELLSTTPALEGWYTTEEAALHHYTIFLNKKLSSYKEGRDSLEASVTEQHTSRMSLALAWGLVSARTLRHKIQEYFGNDFIRYTSAVVPPELEGPVHYLSELIWREFYKYLLFHNPALLDEEFQEKYRRKITWLPDEDALARFTAWIKGETGYEVVDAAMQELAHTGWMHNRSRMIVASVLTKNLGVDWRWGQEYFRAQLVDLDEASNNGGWQWGASVGADPKPIRIFNPTLQAQNYDKSGAYRKKWLPPERAVLALPPIVPHALAREEALKRYGLSRHHLARDY